MTEADEIAAAAITANSPPAPHFASIGAARAWYVTNNPTWHQFLGYQQLDNVAESLFAQRPAMPPHEAWLYAASWGSYMHGGDPGACMYGFNEHFRVQSERHRAACLAWIADCRRIVEASPGDYEPDELDRMSAFEAALRAAPVAEG